MSRVLKLVYDHCLIVEFTEIVSEIIKISLNCSASSIGSQHNKLTVPAFDAECVPASAARRRQLLIDFSSLYSSLANPPAAVAAVDR